jgi:hypothetical protein
MSGSRICLGGAILLLVVAVTSFGDVQSQADIAKLGKAATVLLEANDNAQGSAFCIHSAGFFITNQHVVRQQSVVPLIMNPGQKTEKTLQARVIRTDADLDLALLQVSGEKKLPALTLGSEEGLAELTEVVAFGFPFGSGLATNKKEKPAISVNVGRITSLRLKEGELHRLQLDAALNPGNSGGPLLDKDGKVVGVVVSGVQGAGVNFAIPVGYLSKFLARPEFVFEPPSIRLARIHDPVDFQVRAISLLPSDKKAFNLDFYLFSDDQKSRKFKMEFKEGSHRVLAEPIPKPVGTGVLHLTAIFEQGAVSGTVSDRNVQIAGGSLKLSDLRRVFGTKRRAILQDGEVRRGEMKNLDAVPVNLGPASITLDLTKAKEFRMERPKGLEGLGCTVVAFQDGKEIARVTYPLTIQGMPQPGAEIVDLDIEPPPLAGETETREMPSRIKDAVVGGGGRYVIMHLPAISKLAVFDVNEAKTTAMLPAPDSTLKFAASLDKLVVALPVSKKIQRWDLNSFQLERSASLDINGEIMSMSLGSASQGPIVLAYKEGKQDGNKFPVMPFPKLCHLSLDTLERRNVILEGHLHQQPAFAHLRCSADGKSTGLWYTETQFTGVAWIKWEGQLGKVGYEHSSRGHVIPGSNSQAVFTGLGMFSAISLMPNQQVLMSGSNPQAQYLPAVYGDYYLQLGRSPKQNEFNPEPDLNIYKRGLAAPLLKRPDIEIPQPDSPIGLNHDFTFDKRVLLIPQAKLLIIIPTSNDRLVLHRLKLDPTLPKTDGSVDQKQ